VPFLRRHKRRCTLHDFLGTCVIVQYCALDVICANTVERGKRVNMNVFPMPLNQRQGAASGLAAAVLFGLSPPLAKLLLSESHPLVIAGLLYLGAGLGLLVFEGLFYRGSEVSRREARVVPTDRWLLAAMVLTGGILGPVFMLWGLQRMTGVLGSLTLNLEAPFTILLAVILYGEHLGRVEAVGAMLIIVAAAVLQYRPGDFAPDGWGFVAIACACLSWALDNNLSQRLSLRDPIVVTRIKTLSAGVCTLSLAVMAGPTFPRASIIIAALVLGLFSYGVSLVLDMRALRLHGAAREAGFLATAPFIGALAAIPILGERWGLSETMATGVMAIGLVLLVRAHHAHPHRHAPLLHDHPHVSEVHHRHGHRSA